jgi:exopolysaccharide production protein ExoY
MGSPSIRATEPGARSQASGDVDLRPVPRGYPLKRAIDIGILLLLPVGVMIALLVAASGGPVFYVTDRRGAGGRIFRMYKFRTMVPGADAVLDAYLQGDPEARCQYMRSYKIKADPRITVMGRFLRRFSLDELPQLINVLRGDMSLVGPRPRGEVEFAAMSGDRLFEAYYLCRPGLTGPWQVSGRSGTDYQTRLELDADYASEVSLGGDLLILAKTVPVALIGTGAY